uniref:Uncharacterized protein n=1 Tax=Caenorhabditis japonica TaxID=281687 RepID=A0A8R1IRW0_CAEJA
MDAICMHGLVRLDIVISGAQLKSNRRASRQLSKNSLFLITGGCETWWSLLSIAYYRQVTSLRDQSFSTSISPQWDDDPLCAGDSIV